MGIAAHLAAVLCCPAVRLKMASAQGSKTEQHNMQNSRTDLPLEVGETLQLLLLVRLRPRVLLHLRRRPLDCAMCHDET